MRKSSIISLFSILIFTTLLPQEQTLHKKSFSASSLICIEGLFDDWADIVCSCPDPSGDFLVEDFSGMKITNDDDFLYISFSFHNGDQLLQSNNNVRLYIDTDNKTTTGYEINGIGAELEYAFGPESGFFYHSSGSDTVSQYDLTLRRAPSVSSERFEIGIARSCDALSLNGTQTADTVSVVIVESDPQGDRVPDTGGLQYIIDNTPVQPVEPIPLERFHENDVRVVTYNLQNHKWHVFEDEQQQYRLARILKALDPDIIVFQHVHTDKTVDSLISEWFPETEWHMMGNYGPPGYYLKESDKFVFSKYPILQQDYQFIQDERMYACLLDTRQELGSDLLIINTHLAAYIEYDHLRQRDADEFISVMREWRSGTGPFPLDEGTPFVVAGDLNMYGRGQVLKTIRDGDIADVATYGDPSPPDWDSTSLADVFSLHTHLRMGYTWRNDEGPFCPGKLDYFLYSDAVIDIGNHFVLNTTAMSDEELQVYGLKKMDTDSVSRHLPHVLDITEVHIFGVEEDPWSGSRQELEWYPVYPNPFNSNLFISYCLPEKEKTTLCIYNLSGQEIIILDSGLQPAGDHTIRWDGKDKDGRHVDPGIYVCVLHAGDRIMSQKIICNR